MKWPLRTEQRPYVPVLLLSAEIRSGRMTALKGHNKILKVGTVRAPRQRRNGYVSDVKMRSSGELHLFTHADLLYSCHTGLETRN